jgi:hypothetical protein
MLLKPIVYPIWQWAWSILLHLRHIRGVAMVTLVEAVLSILHGSWLRIPDMDSRAQLNGAELWVRFLKIPPIVPHGDSQTQHNRSPLSLLLLTLNTSPSDGCYNLKVCLSIKHKIRLRFSVLRGVTTHMWLCHENSALRGGSMPW